MHWSTPYESSAGGGPRLPRFTPNGVLAKKLSLTAVVLGLVVAVVGGGTWAAFSATTENAGNSFSTGSVTLTNDRATAMFSVTDMGPGQTAGPECIEVTYAGSLNAEVKLYGTTDAGGLDPYLDLVVERGATCAAFGTPTEIFNDTLANFPDSYADPAVIVDPDATWTSGETAAYRFTVTLQNDPDAEGLAVEQAFTWEARTP